MRERAAALGGTLTTESAPNMGTIVRLWLPLEIMVQDDVKAQEAHV
jgi:signal transduction histidine kinase